MPDGHSAASDPSAIIQCSLLLSTVGADVYQQRMKALLTHAVEDLEARTRELLRASAADLQRLREYGAQHRLTVVSERPEGGELCFEGTRADIDQAFSALPVLARLRAHAPAADFPVRLEGSVVAFFTSDDSEIAASPDTGGFGQPAPGTPVFTAPALARHYRFPAGSDGAGVKAGVVLRGGGFADRGLDTYFRALGLAKPEISVVEVGSARNQPASYDQMKALLEGLLGTTLTEEAPAAGSGRAWGTKQAAMRLLARRAGGYPLKSDAVTWTLEGLMDVQILAGVAPGAAVNVYVAGGNTHALYQAITRAADDGVAVLSCSFSGPESQWSPGEREIVDRALLYALIHGMTVCFSSGNDGSGPAGATAPMVNYPSSSPWVLCCGGTRIDRTTDLESPEQVWNETGPLGQRAASGGGFSAAYPRPPWQVDLDRKDDLRGLPDVAANSAFQSGVWLWIARDSKPMGLNIHAVGTSASAPVWSGLVAVIAQALGRRVGFLNPRLYQPGPRAAFRGITDGDNIVDPALTEYRAHPGWNACTGLGRPVGDALADALR